MPRRKKPIETPEEIRARWKREEEQEREKSLLHAASVAGWGKRNDKRMRAAVALVYLLLLIGAGLVFYLLLARGLI